ncbi:hypothetical protein NQ317_003793 [Molorchus minor]|uniref:Cytochrome P450 n=1 Tax=Molorchus minor TaxID=1323400 RepID=A0ABQ9JWJ3_9CUCU|nr:hypothetical protein NQ317_003793 [Molorchus minor]
MRNFCSRLSLLITKLLNFIAGDFTKQVFEEQRSIFEDDLNRTVTFDDLNQMRYLESVVKESMRLLPPVPLIGRMTNRDVQYKGNTIPAGTSIAIFIHGIHKDPDYFPDPEKFDPSRFLQNDGTNPYSYIPFSAGPRNCIGQKFAMLEMKSCLSNVIRKFELRPSVPEHKMIMTSNIIFKSENGVKLRFLKRG